MSKRRKEKEVDVAAAKNQFSVRTTGELIHRDLLAVNLDRSAVVREILVREAKGEVVDMDDLLRTLRHAPDEMSRMDVLERVKARADQLQYRHWHVCVKMCGPKVKDWAEKNRPYFNKKPAEDTVMVALPEAIPA